MVRLKMLKKQRLLSRAAKIIGSIEGMLLKEKGGQRVVVETARALDEKILENIRTQFKKEDVVAYKVNPLLIAGIRISINNEYIIDSSLKAKLKRMFAVK